MPDNPLTHLAGFGQSVWLDFISRHMFDSGELQRYIDNDDLRGVTSNPAIFEKAIDDSTDYDDAIAKLARAGKTTEQIYESLTVEDVGRAADIFRPVYDKTDGVDGYVSLEVSPLLAEDTDGTIAEARKLWKLLNRPNVLIKVPATREGVPAIQALISEGINVNVTLLFSVWRYKSVAFAYLAGLQARMEKGLPIDHVASVASFFLSRIDTMVDPYIAKALKMGGERMEAAEGLTGRIAILSAQDAYRAYKEIFGSPEFKELIDKGAKPQRLLWASTSTKNPEYSDVKYVEALIGRQTINTMPLETLNAYRDHGHPDARLEQGLDEVPKLLDQLVRARISLEAVGHTLVDEAVQKFVDPYKKLLASIETKRKAALAGTLVGAK